MIETFITLIFAHALADFVFQTKRMVDHKRKATTMGLHIGIYAALTFVLTGGHLFLALGVAALHLIIDAVKIWGLPKDRFNSLTTFLADQGAHLLVLIGAAIVVPSAFAEGWFGHNAATSQTLGPVLTHLPHVMVVLTGGILAIRMGQFLVEHLMALFQLDQDTMLEGLPKGGAAIGVLERTLSFLLVISGQAAGVGFLIAAKSFLRVGSIEKNRRMAEYVIIGTLASIGWALCVAFATAFLLKELG